jgi:hypothetical protein
MTTLLNKVFCCDISNLIRLEMERIKFNNVLTEMTETYKHITYTTDEGCYTYHIHKKINRNSGNITRYIHTNIEDVEQFYMRRTDSLKICTKIKGVALLDVFLGVETIVHVRYTSNKINRWIKCLDIRDGFDKFRSYTNLSKH